MTLGPEILNITPFPLQRRRVGARHRVSRACLHDLTVEVRDSLDFLTNDLLISIEADVLSHHLGKQVQTDSHRVPATWWQHFKLEAIKWGNPFFDPAKVRMNTITFVTQFDVHATYPELNMALPPTVGKVYLDFDITNRFIHGPRRKTHMKAVLITSSNLSFLAGRFRVEDPADVFPLGYTLVTDFGNDDTWEVLTSDVLEEKFTPTGVKLANGFYEIEAIA